MSRSLLTRFLIWRAKHISTRNFILVLSVIVGILSGLAAVIIKTSALKIHELLTMQFSESKENYLFVIYPLLGLLITSAYIFYLNRNKIGAGISRILYAISKKRSHIESDKTYSHIITSSITVGFGGSAGLEAPIVTTSSALASTLGRLMHLDYKKRTLMIGCGAAGAVGALFNAPIAGILFALEVLLLELSIPSFIPVLLAAITGSVTATLLIGNDIIFHYSIKDAFKITQLPWYLILGVLTGLFSLYFSKTILAIDDRLRKYKNRFKRSLIGGIALGALIFLIPALYGEGYHLIKAVLDGAPEQVMNNSIFYGWSDNSWMLMIIIVAAIMLKVVATGITIGAGGNGGIFAPSLFVGGLVGFLIARGFNMSGLGVEISESNFTLVGMAGVMSGAFHAPLTSIFLIAEITNGYELVLPLMLVSTISYVTYIYFEPYSFFTQRLARTGDLISHDKDKEVLTLLDMDKVIEKDLLTVYPDNTLGDLVQVVAKSHRNIFPVVDDHKVLNGIVSLDDIREIMFQPDKYEKIHVRDIMKMPPGYVFANDDMATVMQKFQNSGAWNLPVIKEEEYVGFLSKSKIFSAYRTMLIKQSKDEIT